LFEVCFHELLVDVDHQIDDHDHGGTVEILAYFLGLFLFGILPAEKDRLVHESSEDFEYVVDVGLVLGNLPEQLALFDDELLVYEDALDLRQLDDTAQLVEYQIGLVLFLDVL